MHFEMYLLYMFFLTVAHRSSLLSSMFSEKALNIFLRILREKLSVDFPSFPLNGGFLSHRGTPRYHPFTDDFPMEINHPAIGGTTIYGNPHVKIPESIWIL